MNSSHGEMASEAQAVSDLFAKTPVSPDASLIVHSAFSQLSRVGFKAEAFIKALIQCLPHGNLLMPTMSWRTVNADNPLFDVDLTPSHTGILTEIFRCHFATRRSVHPTHSVAGLGPNVDALLSTHHYTDEDGYLTPCSRNSPYGILYNQFSNQPVYILLLGVSLESCTAIHHAEEIVAPHLYLRPKNESEALQMRANNEMLVTVLNRRHRRLPRDFNRFLPALENEAQVFSGRILGCPWQLVSLHDLLDEVFAAFEQNVEATLQDSVDE